MVSVSVGIIQASLGSYELLFAMLNVSYVSGSDRQATFEYF
jgi:hypothetical protein